MPEVSVIICAYTEERWEALLQAVDSVRQQNYPPAEIIVVIDHNERLFKRAQAQFSKPVRVIENSERQGLSGARNSGIAAARGEVIAFMDEDAHARPGWLERLVRQYEDPQVLGAGGAIHPHWLEGRPRWFPEEFDWVVGCTYRGMPETAAPVRNLIGCNMSFRRAVVEKTGPFQHGIGRVGTLPMGCEETEFSIRAQQLNPGGQLIFDPQSGVSHRVPAHRSSPGYFISRCYSEGRSKALISRLVGTQKSLSNEWTYTRQTLPAGMLRGLKDALHGDIAGLGRAAAIGLGLGLTTLGFIHGKLLATLLGFKRSEPEEFFPGPTFQPARVTEVEISQPLPVIQALDPKTEHRYRRAVVLVRLHTAPLGIIELDMPEDGLGPASYARRIWEEMGAAINAHLQSDGLPPVTGLVPEGLPPENAPRCLVAKAEAMKTAPLVSVIIATRDRLDTLVPCLESLMAQDYQNFEVIVVDNKPNTNATAEYFKDNYRSSIRVRYVREDIPGLAVAHNRGLLEVHGEIVAITDDDVLLDRHWLSSIVAAFDCRDQVACVTGMIMPAELETPSQAWIEQFGGFGKGYTQRTFDMKENRPDNLLYPYSAGLFGSGANMAFRTRILVQNGGFDPALGAGSLAMGGDDLAAFFDVVVRGYQLVYEPGAILYHRHRREYKGLRRQAYGYGVGLSAFLMKTVIDQPGRLFELARKVPSGLSYLLSPRSNKNRKKRADYPSELSSLELKGFLYGPLAYLRSRWRSRPARQTIQQLVTPAVTDSSSLKPGR